MDFQQNQSAYIMYKRTEHNVFIMKALRMLSSSHLTSPHLTRLQLRLDLLGKIGQRRLKANIFGENWSNFGEFLAYMPLLKVQRILNYMSHSIYWPLSNFFVMTF
jgi:hypothetical protein